MGGINITKEYVTIDGIEYEVLDKCTPLLTFDFAKNNFYNVGNKRIGNGDGRISFNKKYDFFKSFFDIETDLDALRGDGEKHDLELKNFILLKEDLDSYLYEGEYKFKNPKIKDIYYFRKNPNQINNISKYDEIKISLNNDFAKNKKKLDSFKETYEFKMWCLLDSSDDLWLRHENAHQDDDYRLIRQMTIPYYSYFSILKIRKNKEIIYYIRLCFKNKLTPERLEDNLKGLEINPNTIKQLCASLNAGQNIILTGVPGTGKTQLATIFAKEFMGENGYILTTATADWTTFDTIGGLMPNEDGELVFHEGKFLQAIRENKWLIIDEINRADIDKAFGQLFTVLSGHDVELPYLDAKENPIKIVMNNNIHMNQYVDGTYYIGKNWRIIATMNSYDKNTLFDLSYAFMRRFMFVEIEVPDSFLFTDKLKNDDGKILDGIDNIYYEKLRNLFEINNKPYYENIRRKIGPAIFLDIFKYINSRSQLSGYSFEYDSEILGDAINAYMIPQFEGLGKNIKHVKNFFKNNVFKENNDQKGFKIVESKLGELEPKKFKNK